MLCILRIKSKNYKAVFYVSSTKKKHDVSAANKHQCHYSRHALVFEFPCVLINDIHKRPTEGRCVHADQNGMLSNHRKSTSRLKSVPVTNSMEQSPPWEPKGRSGSQEIPFLWNPKVRYRIENSPLLDSILRQIKAVQTLSVTSPS